MASPHVLAIPFPAQGHVIPILELSQCLAKNGFKVTLVNTEFNHKRVTNALEDQTDCNNIGDKIRLVSIPDGMEPWEDRNKLAKLCKAMTRVVPGKLEELINKINASEEEKIGCVIADEGMGWAFEVAAKMNIRSVVFWPASAALLCSCFSITKMIDDGIINSNGTPVKNQLIQLSPTMPYMKTAHFVWSCIGDLASQKVIFDITVANIKAVEVADCVICNSVYEFEPGAFDLFPKIQPIGPLLSSNRRGNSAGSFWHEDSTCLQWLDQQEPNSVIYVAFGSFTIFNRTQFQELALGLELSNRPFLWVVRRDISDQLGESYPEGFQQRVANRGRTIEWAPQQKVLSHPSVGCFLSHCGWNSTMEGVCNGVTFLCWPYFADQFINESYICDVWKVGLKFDRDETGIITRHKIKNRIEEVTNDKIFKVRSLELKEKAIRSVAEGATSSNNFKNLVEWVKYN